MIFVAALYEASRPVTIWALPLTVGFDYAAQMFGFQARDRHI
jgi:hypothetical protein